MAILDYPTSDLFHGAQFDFGLVSNSWAFRSPLSQAVQTVGMPGARWRARILWDSNGLNRDESDDVEAFLVQVRGMSNRIRLWNVAKEEPRGMVQGAPVIFGSDQAGAQVTTQGWSASKAGLLVPSEMISAALGETVQGRWARFYTACWKDGRIVDQPVLE